MDEVVALLDVLSRVGPIGGTVVILFFMYRAGIIRFGSNGHAKSAEDPPPWARQLQEHFNDTTTHLLQKIVDKSTTQCQKLDKIIGFHEDSKEDDFEWRREMRDFMRDIDKRT